MQLISKPEPADNDNFEGNDTIGDLEIEENISISSTKIIVDFNAHSNNSLMKLAYSSDKGIHSPLKRQIDCTNL